MAAKFTTTAQRALESAQAEAIRRSQQEITPEHVLFALTTPSDDGSGGMIPHLLESAGASPAAIHASAERALSKFSKVQGGEGQIYASPQFTRLMVLAESEAKKLEDAYVSVEHFFSALLSDSFKGTPAQKLLTDAGLTLKK